MVAAIAGNGLGLDNTSLQKLGGSSDGAAQIGQGSGAAWVNLANGNLVLQGYDYDAARGLHSGTDLHSFTTPNFCGNVDEVLREAPFNGIRHIASRGMVWSHRSG